jgi:ribose-phosphate pyrophosphokinase
MIKTEGFSYEKFNFPVGEMHIKVANLGLEPKVEMSFERNEEIVELLLINDALSRMDRRIKVLSIPYVPFGRQDRVAVPGECFSLAVFAQIINQINAENVVVYDPHSDVTTALINNCAVVKQWQIFKPMLEGKSDFLLISPDGGALKKIYELASRVECFAVTECSKMRDVKTGTISGVQVHSNDLFKKDCYIVDDICDGGRTFIEIAKVLKEKNCGKIILMVTHGFFTKGLEVFDGLIDEIYTMRGKVK